MQHVTSFSQKKYDWLIDHLFLQVNHTPTSYPKTTRNLPISNNRFLPETPEQGTCRASWLYASTRASDVVSGWIPGDWRIPILISGRRERSRAAYYVAKKIDFHVPYRDTYSTYPRWHEFFTQKTEFRKTKSSVYIIKPEVDPFSSSDPAWLSRRTDYWVTFPAAKISWWLNQPIWKILVKLDHFPK